MVVASGFAVSYLYYQIGTCKMRYSKYLVFLLFMAIALIAASCSQVAVDFSSRNIQLTSTIENLTDFESAGMGLEGYYFPQFDAEEYVTNRPTDENMQFVEPDWVSFQFNPLCSDRTFSLDAGILSLCPLVIGVCSEGGNDTWERFTLPCGKDGLSGAVIDYATCGNTNNTVNRIHLRGQVPSSFLLHVVVDNRSGTNNTLARFRMRGASSDGLQEVDVTLIELPIDGRTDVYTFQFDNFEEGDFLKIQLNSGNDETPAGFAALMFDLP